MELWRLSVLVSTSQYGTSLWTISNATGTLTPPAWYRPLRMFTPLTVRLAPWSQCQAMISLSSLWGFSWMVSSKTSRPSSASRARTVGFTSAHRSREV